MSTTQRRPVSYSSFKRLAGSSSTRLSALGDRLGNIDLNTPAKIFQRKHALHQFETITPDVSVSVTPSFYTPKSGSNDTEISSGGQAPATPSPIHHDKAAGSGELSPATTPSQFIFNKPEYNSHYRQTHYHRLERKDNLLTELRKKLFKKGPNKKTISSKSSNKKKNEEMSAGRTHKTAPTSFANAFNKDIQGRYGKWGAFVGKGSGGSVRIIRRNTDAKTFAVKQFRRRLAGENEKEYIKKVTAEFCIGSTLHHPNVIEALDMIQEGVLFYEIMEYAPNDLFSIVMSGKMSHKEVACCWHQMLSGVAYLQSVGIAHRDIKLDNMVLDERGILKIIDFGCATVIKYPHETHTRMSKGEEGHEWAVLILITMGTGICGSEPYIAPEQYLSKEYDALASDLWSCGIVYVCMIVRRFPWHIPRVSHDDSFRNFMAPDGAERLFKLLPHYSRPILRYILQPNPSKRKSLEEVLADPWVSSIAVCDPQLPVTSHRHHLLFEPSREALCNVRVLDPPCK